LIDKRGILIPGLHLKKGCGPGFFYIKQMSMKEKILQMIKGKLGQTCLSERTLSQKAERLSKKFTKEEDITDDVIREVVEDLKDLEGQYNHDVAEKAKAIEEQYKASGAAGQGSAGNSGSGSGATVGNGNDTPEWFKEFQKKQEDELAKIRQDLENERVSGKLNAYKAMIRKSMIEKGANREYFVDIVLGKLQKAEDGELTDDALNKFLANYDAEVKNALGDGASPRSGSSNGTGGENGPMKSFFKEKAEELKG
jgi:hypothetical protein